MFADINTVQTSLFYKHLVAVTGKKALHCCYMNKLHYSFSIVSQQLIYMY